MSYGYMSNSGVLHVVADRKSAKENSRNGKIVETSIPNEGGYPIVSVGNGDTSSLIVYLEGDAFIHGNSKSGHAVSLSNYSEVHELFNAVK